jgi:sialate O-acetylesterase
MKRLFDRRIGVVVICIGYGVVAEAAVKLPPVISSHMVLQRDIPAPIWGTASPGEKIIVTFAGQKKEGVADQQGQWKVCLDPLKMSAEPGVMIVSGVSEKLELQDILVGEVWVGSGQSNMAGGAGGYAKKNKEMEKLIAEGPYPQVRVLSSGSEGWMTSTPEALTGFSALLISFGLPLHRELKVPVGLLVGAVSGTPSVAWVSRQAYDNDPGCKDLLVKLTQKDAVAAAKKKYEMHVEKWKKDVAEAEQRGEKKLPKKPSKPLKSGFSWVKMGNLYERHIVPYIPFAIRGVLWDQGESGTAIGGFDQYTLMGALIKGWRKDWDQDFTFMYVQKPSGGGCAWDSADPVTSKAENLIALPATVPEDGERGESYVKMMTYPNTFMVTSSDLGSGIHPVNKLGYGARSAHVALGAVYGRSVEIYGPVYKEHKVEGPKVIISYTHIGKGLAVKKEVASSASTGLTKLQGFALAGEDGNFVWADAVIDGDTVVLSSATVTKPVAVRYAWAAQHPWANLFNKDGLPALPFRTDVSSQD